MISYINCHNFTLFLSIFYYIVSLLLNITYCWAEVWRWAVVPPATCHRCWCWTGSWQLQAARWTKHTTNWQTGDTTVKTIRKYVGLEPRIQHRLCPSGKENVIASYTTLMWFTMSLVPGQRHLLWLHHGHGQTGLHCLLHLHPAVRFVTKLVLGVRLTSALCAVLTTGLMSYARYMTRRPPTPGFFNPPKLQFKQVPCPIFMSQLLTPISCL